MAGVEDGVKCDRTKEIGKNLQVKWDQMCFTDLTLKKANEMKTMAHISNAHN